LKVKSLEIKGKVNIDWSQKIENRDKKAGTIRKKLPLDAINPAHESLS